MNFPLIFSNLADDAVAELDAGHAAGEVGRGVAVGHVRDQLQAQLPVEGSTKDRLVRSVNRHELSQNEIFFSST